MARDTTDLETLLAAELDHARDMLMMMGDELSTDFAVVSRHGLALQAVDIVGQMLGHIANVVRSDNREDAVRQIGMCELKNKLTRAA